MHITKMTLATGTAATVIALTLGGAVIASAQTSATANNMISTSSSGSVLVSPSGMYASGTVMNGRTGSTISGTTSTSGTRGMSSGATSTTPGIPNTGAGGNAGVVISELLASLLVAVGGVSLLRTRTSDR